VNIPFLDTIVPCNASIRKSFKIARLQGIIIRLDKISNIGLGCG
jgi:hypothetical protein